MARLEEAITPRGLPHLGDRNNVTDAPCRQYSSESSAPPGPQSQTSSMGAGFQASKKRKYTGASPVSGMFNEVPAGPQLWSRQRAGHDNFKAPQSAVDGHDLIQDQLVHNPSIGNFQQESFKSALALLNETLKLQTTTQHGVDEERQTLGSETAGLSRGDWTVPPLETVQWMLTAVHAADALWSVPDGLPIVSRQALVQMALAIKTALHHPQHAAFVVCVNSTVAYFLLEYTTTCKAKTGLEDYLQAEITAYFDTAQAVLDCIGPAYAPSLPALQALVYGSVNAQERGDFKQSRQYTAAACSMCITLGLHREEEASWLPSCRDSMYNARYCLFVSYINDKGLAMNLGKPPCLPDDHIHIDLRQITRPTDPTMRQALQIYYLELAIAQSGIVDLQLARLNDKYDQATGKIKAVLRGLNSAWKMVQDLPLEHAHELPVDDLEYEQRMAKFCYYGIRTVLCHLCSKDRSVPELGEELVALTSARASLSEFKSLRSLFRRAQFGSYRMNSFAHCIVLYYPFTAYFVLFCHVVITSDINDFQLIDEFVGYLAELKDSSVQVEKLHRLCLPFHSLAAFALDPTKDHQHIKHRTTLAGTAAEYTSGIGVHEPATTLDVPESPPPAEGLPAPTLPVATHKPAPPVHADDVRDSIPENPDFSGLNMDIIQDDLLKEMLAEQPSLDWLEYDLPDFEIL